jgi:hypothetical protein
MNDAEFSETVRMIMHARRETRAETAPRCNLSTASFSQRLHGRTRWTIEELALLAAYWKIAPSDLLLGPVHALKVLDKNSAISAA